MHDSVKAIEEKMSAAFTKIDDRLESLDAQTAGSCSSVSTFYSILFKEF